MNPKVIKAYAPGKMYLLGEYAVVVENYPAIVFSLNKGVHVTVKSASKFSIQSTKYNNEQAPMELKNKRLYCKDRRYRYVLTAINTVLAFVGNPEPFQIEIDSELDNVDHKKYGLGSSGALIVATIKAIAQFYDLSFNLKDLFKLSVITQYRLSPFSSFGDLAASVYGGCIYYQKGRTLHLKRTRNPHRLMRVNWDDFIIERLRPQNLHYVIGYSHLHASSTKLVKQVLESQNTMAFNRFLSDARDIVIQAKTAINKHDNDSLFESVRAYRDLLVRLSELTGVEIEVDFIKQMNDRVYNLGGVSKSSGAGGGDCVIALAYHQNMKTDIIKAWESLGVEIISDIQLDMEGE